MVAGRRVLDLCTGSGFVAIAAAELGCASVTAFDICPNAVQCSRDNALDAGVEVDVRQGSWTRAFDCAPFEVVLSNPPYVPTPPVANGDVLASDAGPSIDCASRISGVAASGGGVAAAGGECPVSALAGRISKTPDGVRSTRRSVPSSRIARAVSVV